MGLLWHWKSKKQKGNSRHQVPQNYLFASICNLQVTISVCLIKDILQKKFLHTLLLKNFVNSISWQPYLLGSSNKFHANKHSKHFNMTPRSLLYHENWASNGIFCRATSCTSVSHHNLNNKTIKLIPFSHFL